MSFISEVSQDAWHYLVEQTKGQRPSVGKTVRVVEGRKHLGKIGKVIWHGVNRYSDAWRYGSDAQRHLWDLEGRYGYRVRIQPEDSDTFFVDADKVEVVSE